MLGSIFTTTGEVRERTIIGTDTHNIATKIGELVLCSFFFYAAVGIIALVCECVSSEKDREIRALNRRLDKIEKEQWKRGY